MDYKEKLRLAKEALDSGSYDKETIEYIFPELAKSEDKRVRIKLIEFFKGYYPDKEWWGNITQRDILAWLEKYGEQKFEQKFFINDKVVHKATGKIWTIHYYLKDTNSYYVEDNDGLLHHYRESELKLVEQKPADKVEPKFKVGDEIKTKNEESLIITRIDRWGYWSEDLFICSFDDADKWELVEQKPWSEEDNNCICKIINWLDVCKAYNQDSKSIKEISEHIQWLKSLRPQSQWRPSKEQITVLHDVAAYIDNSIYANQKDILVNLYLQLKKLND